MSGRFEAVIGVIQDAIRATDDDASLSGDQRGAVKAALRKLSDRLGTWEPAHTMMYVDDHVRFCNDLMDVLGMGRVYGSETVTRGRPPVEAILHQVRTAAETKRALLTLRRLWHEGA